MFERSIESLSRKKLILNINQKGLLSFIQRNIFKVVNFLTNRFLSGGTLSKIYELSANVKPYKGNYGVEILSEQIVFTALLKNNTTIVTSSPIIKRSSYEVDIVNEENLSGCIFDIDNQTDDFLKGIDLFKGYVWDNEEKTATLKLESGEVVKIHNGGCHHFSFSATIEMGQVKKLYPIEHFMHYFFSIASKLPEDFDYETVKNEVMKRNYTVMEYDGYTSWRFTEESLQMNNYYISLEEVDNKVHFSFGWTIN